MVSGVNLAKDNKTIAQTRADIKKDSEKWLREQLAELGGEGYGLPLGEQPVILMERISTGSRLLDKAIGGGIPQGAITEIFGPESQGKSSLCYSIMGQAQAKGLVVALVDAEQTFDEKWASNFGVDSSKIWHTAPDSGNEALETVRRYIQSGVTGLIVVDSVTALVPQATLRGEIGDAQMGAKARMMSQALDIINPELSKNNVALIFTNQLRMKIGVTWGNPETTTGGEALKYYASLRLSIRRRGDLIKDGETPIGMPIRVFSQKNKTAAPFRDAELRLMYNSGFDFTGEAIDCAIAEGIITKGGAWYHWDDEKWNGKEKFITWLKDNPKHYNELNKVLDKLP